MAMTVLNNSAANLTLSSLNKNLNKVGKQLSKVAKGERIVGAGDNASDFGISEQMRAKIRTLEQDIRNVQNGSSMLKIASAGIDSIVEELRTLKELAINAANDSNTDEDRKIIQKEFDQRRANIDEIATTTNYNKKPLLDGTYTSIKVASTMTTTASISVPTPKGSPVVIGPSTPVSGNTFRITYDGIYILNRSDLRIQIAEDAHNVLIRQADSSTPLNNVFIEEMNGDNTNLFIENLNINNTTAGSIIKFDGSDNTLVVMGENTLAAPVSSSNTAAVVNIGDGLKVKGQGSSPKLTVSNASGSGSHEETSNGGYGAGIGTDRGQASLGNIEIEDVELAVTVYNGAGIGSGGEGGMVGDIKIINSTIDLHGHYNASIGSGSGRSVCGNIEIGSSRITGHSIDTGIGSGYSGSSCGDITIDKSEISITNRDSACIGAGDANGTCKNITISTSNITGSSEHGACVGSGRSAEAGNIKIIGTTTIKHTSNDGAAIGSGLGGKVGTIKISTASLAALDATEAYTDETHTYPGIGRGRNGSAGDIGAVNVSDDEDETTVQILRTYTVMSDEYNPLWIHHGTKDNQRINVYIRDMHTKSLKQKIPDEHDKMELQRLQDDPSKSQEAKEFYNIIMKARKSNLENTDVYTRFNAKATLRIVDSAIDYALDEATNMGAYLQRLEYTENNVTIENESVQNAESTIRDADMAKEMTDYTKNNVLSQAAQSMLAQANQNLSGVLSLLQ